MILISDVLQIHESLIENFGGSNGIRDFSALESAISRPFQTFDQTELYPTVIEKAACLVESLLNNHPFVDGNKRTGYTVMRLFLIKNGLDIDASQEQKYDFVMNIAVGKTDNTSIVKWLSDNTKI